MELSEQDVEDGLKVLERYCHQTYGIEMDGDALCQDITVTNTNASATLDCTAADDGTKNVRTASDDAVNTESDAGATEVIAAVRSYWRWLTFVFERLNRLRLNQLVMIALVTVYALLGGFIFHLIEAPHEALMLARAKDDALSRHIQFAAMLANLTNCSAAEDLSQGDRQADCQAAIRPILCAYDEHSGLAQRLKEPVWCWNYANAVFYAATIFTTIGYGHMACRTQLGRAVTMLYALVGIPLTLILLKNIGAFIFSWADARWKTFMRCVKIQVKKVKKQKSVFATAATMPGVDATLAPSFRDTFPLPLVLVTVLLYTVLCAMLFSLWEEDWDYFTGVYFFFISLTTIGLGDEMPKHPSYALGFLFFFVIGLALLSMCVGVLHARLEAKYMAALHLIDLRTRPRPVLLPKTADQMAALLAPDADGAAILASMGLPPLHATEGAATDEVAGQTPEGTLAEVWVADGLNDSEGAKQQTERIEAERPTPTAVTQVLPPAVVAVLMAGRRQQRRDLMAAASTVRSSRRSSVVVSESASPMERMAALSAVRLKALTTVVSLDSSATEDDGDSVTQTDGVLERDSVTLTEADEMAKGDGDEANEIKKSEGQVDLGPTVTAGQVNLENGGYTTVISADEEIEAS